MTKFVARQWMLGLGLVAALVCGLTSEVSAQVNSGGNPTYGSVNLRGGFTPDPYTKQITAGGREKVTFANNVARNPDFVLNWTAAGQRALTIYAESQQDTTLLIHTPDGSWIINDDGGQGLNPLVKFLRPMSGRYAIWVGTFNQGNVPATLGITELK